MGNTSVKWIVHDRMLKGESYQNLPDIIRAQGHDCYEIKDYSLMDDLDQFNLPSTNHCAIPYCTVNLSRNLKKYFGMFVNEHNLKTHVYTSWLGLPPKTFLNWNARLTTYFDFKHSKDFWYNHFYEHADNYKDCIFIRPDSGMKLFTGHLIPIADWEHEINFLETTGITNESLIWVTNEKIFWDETRFVICGDQVVDGSRYATNSGSELIVDKHFPAEFWDFANTVAKGYWKPDEIFVCDVCMTYDGPKVVELNSFNCASFYACDVEKIVKVVSEHTLEIWKEQYG